MANGIVCWTAPVSSKADRWSKKKQWESLQWASLIWVLIGTWEYYPVPPSYVLCFSAQAANRLPDRISRSIYPERWLRMLKLVPNIYGRSLLVQRPRKQWNGIYILALKTKKGTNIAMQPNYCSVKLLQSTSCWIYSLNFKITALFLFKGTRMLT